MSQRVLKQVKHQRVVDGDKQYRNVRIITCKHQYGHWKCEISNNTGMHEEIRRNLIMKDVSGNSEIYGDDIPAMKFRPYDLYRTFESNEEVEDWIVRKEKALQVTVRQFDMVIEQQED